MLYIVENKTGRIVYLSRFIKRTRKYFNTLRPGMSYRIVRDNGLEVL